jgi:hypothetical protein
MPLAVSIPTDKGQFVRAAADGDMHLVYGHGGYVPNNGSFKIPEGHIIVFLAEPGRRLPVTVVDQRFYDMFTSKRAVKNMILSRMKDLPWYLRGWKTRTYGPGESCPDLSMDFSDPCWTIGMGVHDIPLTYPLRSTSSVDTMCSRVQDGDYYTRATGVNKRPRPAMYTGSIDIMLSSIVRPGVTFVVACRSIIRTTPYLTRYQKDVLQTARRDVRAHDAAIAPINESKRKRVTLDLPRKRAKIQR